MIHTHTHTLENSLLYIFTTLQTLIVLYLFSALVSSVCRSQLTQNTLLQTLRPWQVYFLLGSPLSITPLFIEHSFFSVLLKIYIHIYISFSFLVEICANFTIYKHRYPFFINKSRLISVWRYVFTRTKTEHPHPHGKDFILISKLELNCFSIKKERKKKKN